MDAPKVAKLGRMQNFDSLMNAKNTEHTVGYPFWIGTDNTCSQTEDRVENAAHNVCTTEKKLALLFSGPRIFQGSQCLVRPLFNHPPGGGHFETYAGHSATLVSHSVSGQSVAPQVHSQWFNENNNENNNNKKTTRSHWAMEGQGMAVNPLRSHRGQRFQITTTKASTNFKRRNTGKGNSTIPICQQCAYARFPSQPPQKDAGPSHSNAGAAHHLGLECCAWKSQHKKKGFAQDK